MDDGAKRAIKLAVIIVGLAALFASTAGLMIAFGEKPPLLAWVAYFGGLVLIGVVAYKVLPPYR